MNYKTHAIYLLLNLSLLFKLNLYLNFIVVYEYNYIYQRSIEGVNRKVIVVLLLGYIV